jgi:molecular chaperone GrpE (heat shock protein)
VDDGKDEKTSSQPEGSVVEATGTGPGGAESSASGRPEKDESLLQRELSRVFKTLDELRSHLSTARERIEGLQEQFSQRLAYDAAKDGMIRTLSDEVSRYRDDWFARQLRPLVLDCVHLLDTLEAVQAGLHPTAQPPADEISEKLNVVRAELLELLARQDVTPFDSHPDRLDPRLHRTLAVEETDTPADDKAISRVVRTGFMWRTQVLRPEEVVVKKFTNVAAERRD